jgi:pre-mRNA-splicing factor CDC5/CEF1
MNLDNGVPLSGEDAAEQDENLQKRQEETERLALVQRSQVIRLGLPWPPQVDPEQLLQNQAQYLINQEMVQLMQHDSIAHPLPGTSLPGRTESQYAIPPADDIAAALSEIHLKLAQSLGFPDATQEHIRHGITTLAKAELERVPYWTHNHFAIYNQVLCKGLPSLAGGIRRVY